MNPRLTIGCAVYDDILGLWPTLQALRLYHADLMPQCELIVVDNNPSGGEGESVGVGEALQRDAIVGKRQA